MGVLYWGKGLRVYDLVFIFRRLKMGRPLVTRKYNPQFIRILDELKADPPQPAIFGPFESPRDAKSFQMQFLSFRNAAAKEQWDLKPADDPLYFPDLNSYTTRLSEDKLTVEVWHNEYTPEALQLRRMFMARDRR